MFHRKLLPTMFGAIALVATQSIAALAQPWPGFPEQGTVAPFAPVTTLRDPLIPGTPTSPAFAAPAYGQPPPSGSGATPPAVNPGMRGAPTLVPSVTAIPFNSVDQRSSPVVLPWNPAVVSAPGALGPALTGFVPGPESTLGSDPGSLTTPSGYINAAQQTNINQNGAVPGMVGYPNAIQQFNNAAPTVVIDNF